jgi:hypothetical protein
MSIEAPTRTAKTSFLKAGTGVISRHQGPALVACPRGGNWRAASAGSNLLFRFAGSHGIVPTKAQGGHMRTLAAFAFTAVLCFGILPAQADKRIALVIGNSSYSFAPLTNHVNDADDLTAALRRLHFDVTEIKNLAIRAFDDALDKFVEHAKDADIAMFFFSGHGVQIDHRGYLAPVDIRAETESSALRELVAIQEVVSRIENAAKVSVIVLDACRDSPLQERLRRIAESKNKALERPKGLPYVPIAGSDTLVVYATVPGEIALDGPGRNSPFTTALLEHIETPGLDVEVMFKLVTAGVLSATGGKQQPERLSRLQSVIVLLIDTAEQDLWDSVKDSTNSDIIQTYLTKYPNGIYRAIARARITLFEQQRLLDEAVEKAKRKEAELRGLEETLKMREKALDNEKKRAQEANKAPPTEQKEEQNLEAQLRKAREDNRIAREAAQDAEQRRQAAEKAAAEARRTAERPPTEIGKGNDARMTPPANLARYSLNYWPRNSLAYKGQTVTTNTPHGRLTCTSNGRDTPRTCSLR